ncbi:MAG: alpha-galactosidase [Leptospiraceae bacterium]|jgi:alpha-galactosidase|nr:alpha-galactosidase [Leptospiraceae bacterium]
MSITENIELKRVIFQKKNRFYEFSVNKQIQEKLVLRTEFGYLNFEFQNQILNAFFTDFVNRDDIPIDFVTLDIVIPSIDNFISFLHQGYNNWTQTHEVPISSKQMNVSNIIKWLLSPFGEYTIIKFIKNFNKNFLRSHFYTYLRDKNNQILAFCSLNEKISYTIFQLDYKNSILRIIKDFQNYFVGARFEFLKLFIGYGDYYDIFDNISQKLESVKENFVTGYTSWYYHYNNLNIDELIRRIEFYGINKIPIDYFQIDDGYQKRVGDWTNLKEDFHDRMKELVGRIKKYNIKPGIWIAPFICERKSSIYQYHQEWLLRDEKDKPIVAGFNPLWSGKFYSLNIYNPDFQEYIRSVFKTFTEDWGFELLKLDFLYASCIYPAKRKTRAQQMQDALDLIHQSVQWKKSPVKLLGCGIPFSHAFGNVNFTRVGSDVEEKWEHYLKHFNFLERVSTFSSLNSTIYRHFFNGKNFLNDPDVFYLRQNFRKLKTKEILEKIKLTEQEKLTLLYINHIFGGLVFTSDPIELYPKEILHLYKKTFPFVKKQFKKFYPVNEHAFEVHFSVLKEKFLKNPKMNNFIDYEVDYLFLTNLSNKNVVFPLEKNQAYFVAFPFQDTYGTLIVNKESIELKAHHSLLLLKLHLTPFELIGSNGHILPLVEFKSYTRKVQGFTIEMQDQAFEYSNLYIYIPQKEKEKYTGKYKVLETEGVSYIALDIIK